MEKYCEDRNILYLAGLNKQNSIFSYYVAKYIIDNNIFSKDTIYYKRSIDILDMVKQYVFDPDMENICKNHGGMKNISASCYLDSIFMSLFFIPNKFINNTILYSDLTNSINNCSIPVQEELNNIVENIRNNTIANCRIIRNIFKLCPHIDEFHKGGSKDAIEFLSYILDMFPATNSATKIITNYVTNNLSSNNISEFITTNINKDNNASIVQFVDSFRLNNSDNLLDIRNFLELEQDTILDEENLFEYINNGKLELYKRRLEVIKFVDSEYLIFALQRLDPIEEKFINKNIIPTKFITLDSGRQLCLNAVVVHHGTFAHYTCYLLCNDKWYHYDDLNPSKLKLVGSYVDLLKTNKPSILKNGILYFYC